MKKTDKETQRIPVFFHASNKYCPPMSATMASILTNTQSFVEFYVIYSDISSENQRKIESMQERFPHFSIEWIKFEYNDIFKKKYFDRLKDDATEKNLDAWGPPIHRYSTPFMPLLKPDMEKFIALDTDLIVLGDIATLYNEPLDDYPLAAVFEASAYIFVPIKMRNPNIDYEAFPYFNSGVRLINGRKFREENIIERYFEIAATEHNPYCDQCVLNRLFIARYKHLDLKYNIVYDPTAAELTAAGLDMPPEVFKEARKNMFVRHYAGLKPWAAPLLDFGYFFQGPLKLILDPKLFWHYAKMTPFYEEIRRSFISSLRKIPSYPLYFRHILRLPYPFFVIIYVIRNLLLGVISKFFRKLYFVTASEVRIMRIGVYKRKRKRDFTLLRYFYVWQVRIYKERIDYYLFYIKVFSRPRRRAL